MLAIPMVSAWLWFDDQSVTAIGANKVWHDQANELYTTEYREVILEYSQIVDN